LPFSYGEADRVVAEAVAAACWQEVGALAEAEAQRLHSHGGQFHRLETAVVEKLRHPPGRPPRDRPRPVASVRYLVQARPEPDAMRIARQREEAGCFVLLSNVPEQGPHARTGPDLLHAYKDTLRPTTFMMTTKFAGLQIARIGERYRLAQPPRHVQAAYLRALNLSPDELLSPPTGPP
jgi:hypothetical protein